MSSEPPATAAGPAPDPNPALSGSAHHGSAVSGAAGSGRTSSGSESVDAAGTGPARRTGGLLSGVDWSRPPAAHTVTLLGKPGCHLCDEAREVVTSVCEQTGSAYEERDITGDPELVRDYAEYVPVVFVDGVAWDRLRIDAARLRAVLT